MRKGFPVHANALHQLFLSQKVNKLKKDGFEHHGRWAGTDLGSPLVPPAFSAFACSSSIHQGGQTSSLSFFFSPKSPKLHREVVIISSQCSQPHQGPKNTKPSYLLQLMQVSCSGEKTKSTRGKKQNYLWEKALDHIGKETTDCFLFAVLILIIFINCRSYWGLSQINSVMRT